MDETDTLRRLLRTTADEAGDWTDPPSATAMAAHRRRRRRAVAGAGLAVIAVVAVAVPVAISTAHRHPTESSLVGPTVATSASTVLPGGRWTMLPKAPIIARSPAATAWTGTQMLVWGGANGNTEYADGAAYNPATRTWTAMPKSPLSARSYTASVWTGRYLFLFGNGDGDVGRNSDAALYDPSASTWTTVPPAPLPGYTTVEAYWTGRQVLLLSVLGRNVNRLVLQAFDPSSRRWTRLPNLELRPKHDGQLFGAVVAGSTFYVWSEWSHTSSVQDGAMTTAGIDAYSFDLSRRQWSPRHFTPPVERSVRDPVWTGDDILIPPAERWCGFCAGPFDPHPTGAQVDPRSRTVHAIAPGPVGNAGGPYFWTGAALLAGGSGEAAYWTPATNRWTLLPHAPLAGYGAAVVWTGHSLLIWGQLSPSAHPSAKPTGAGIELSR
jgi:hypothetical protein